MVRVEFVCGASGLQHDALLVPEASTTAHLSAIISALTLTTTTKYIFLLDDAHQLHATLGETLLEQGRSVEQAVRLYYHRQEEVQVAGEGEQHLYPDWIRNVRGLRGGGVCVSVYDGGVHVGGGGGEVVLRKSGQVVNDIVEVDNGIVCGSADGRLYHIFDSHTASGACSSAVHKVLEHGGLVFAGEQSGAISVHDPKLFTTPSSSDTTRNRSKRKAQKPYTPIHCAAIHDDCVSAILSSTDGKVTTCGHDRRIQQLDAGTLTRLTSHLSPAHITAAHHLPAAKVTALGHADGTLRLYDPASCRFAFATPKQSWISSVCGNTQKPHLVAVADHAGQVALFDVRQMREAVWRNAAGGGKVLAVDFSVDGRKLYYGGEQCILHEYAL